MMQRDPRLTSQHVLAAMERIRVEGVPALARSTRYDVLHPDDGAAFPPKLVLSIAMEVATGQPLPRTEFSGGEQTNAPLRELGFEIVEKTAPRMAATPDDLPPGSVLTNDELSQVFGVGNAGGMRWSSIHQHLVIIADHTKSLYDDRWEGNVLHYTGMGQAGNQTLSGQNKRLADQRLSGINVFLFEVHTPGKYEFAGRVHLVSDPYLARQPDGSGSDRSVYVFPVALEKAGRRPTPTQEQVREIERARQRALARQSDAELLRRAVLGALPNPTPRQMITTQYERNPAIAELVKRLAKGQCDLCRSPAPFEANGAPFLECHHVVQLAKGGPDTIENTVALCPNCHRKMHALDLPGDRQKLVARISARTVTSDAELR